MSEMHGIGMDKKMLEMKAEHEKVQLGFERKYQRQIMDARRKNEESFETLRRTYESEIESLRSKEKELQLKNKDLERELEVLNTQLELLKSRMSASDNEQTLHRRLGEKMERQADLVTKFLEQGAGRGTSESLATREESAVLRSSVSESASTIPATVTLERNDASGSQDLSNCARTPTQSNTS